MHGFIHSLVAPGPAADRAAAMDTYGWLVGDWVFDAQITADDGSVTRVGGGEIHAAWVLEGRAIQDVWILPGVFVGSTLRVYDPGTDSWHIVWSDPLRQYYNRQQGSRRGDRIVQEGVDGTGNATRWSFARIRADSFRWHGERRASAHDPWQPVADFSARRTHPATPEPGATA